MSNFFVGTLVGFFLGALVMFVGVGIICLYLVERREKSDLARPRAARETRDEREAPTYTPTKGPRIPPIPGPGET